MALITAQAVTFTPDDLILTNPATQRRVIDPQLPGHPRHRLTRSTNNLNRVPFELIAELPSRSPCLLFLSQSDSPPGPTPIIRVSSSQRELHLPLRCRDASRSGERIHEGCDVVLVVIGRQRYPEATTAGTAYDSDVS